MAASGSPSPDPEVVVAGAGPMAEEHVRALLAAGLDASRIVVAGRSRDRAEALARRHGVRAVWNGELPAAPLAVVAVTETALVATAERLLDAGAHTVLLEKPGALSAEALAPLRGRDARVYVGYNRRFYPAVAEARRLIAADGGPLAFTFDFTELPGRVLDDAARRGLSPEVLERWGLANSLHVLDLAFHLGGDPAALDARRAGSLDWHPAGATYAGSGATAAGALFSYVATWGGAGRWGVEVTTAERRLVLRPLETLQEQRSGSFALTDVELLSEPVGVKAGLAGQLRAVLDSAAGRGEDPALCTVDEAVRRLRVAERILGYGPG